MEVSIDTDEERDLCAAVLGFLADAESPPPGGQLNAERLLVFLRMNGLAPLFYLRLGEREHPLRTRVAADFAEAFERRARLTAAWGEAVGELHRAGVESLTLGSLPFADKLFGHPAARLHQDIDLLVRPTDEGRAREVLLGLGWRPRGGCWDVAERDGLHLDLHMTPGEERRFPVLAKAFGQTTEALFESAGPCDGGPEHARMPGAEAQVNNRVLHFYKHYCQRLIFALEIAFLLRGPLNSAKLSQEVERSGSGRIWAFVLELLRRWGLVIAADPVTEADRRFLRDRVVARVLERVARLRGGRSPLWATMRMLPFPDRCRFAWAMCWPSRALLMEMHSRESLSAGELARLRLSRARKALAFCLRGR